MPQIHRMRHRLLKELGHAVEDRHVTRAMLILLESGIIYTLLCVRFASELHHIVDVRLTYFHRLPPLYFGSWPRMKRIL
jgi:hypothetical protein